MTLHHVICLFIVNKKKRNIKSRKIDKRKRKMLVFKHNITLTLRYKQHEEEKIKEIEKNVLLLNSKKSMK